jgi:hypothetical protein
MSEAKIRPSSAGGSDFHVSADKNLSKKVIS